MGIRGMVVDGSSWPVDIREGNIVAAGKPCGTRSRDFAFCPIAQRDLKTTRVCPRPRGRRSCIGVSLSNWVGRPRPRQGPAARTGEKNSNAKDSGISRRKRLAAGLWRRCRPGGSDFTRAGTRLGRV